MTIRHGLLALLEQEPMYGYQLRAEFDRATGSTWALNVGQVYSTLARLERDGLVEGQGDDGEGRTRYAITPAGRAELRGWFDRPVEQANRPRDELAIKLALAVTVPGIDVSRVVQTQRSATLRSLQQLTRLKAEHQAEQAQRPVSQQAPDPSGGGSHRPAAAALSWSLVLESLRFAADAELRWLDHCEASVLRTARAQQAAAPAAAGPRETADPDPIPGPIPGPTADAAPRERTSR
jgi:DNA-binding PadR family transcriptional regulator